MDYFPSEGKVIMNVGGWLRSFKYAPMSLIILSFASGVLFGPWSWGIFPLLLFIVAYEFLYYFLTWGNNEHWQVMMRCVVILATLLGWIISRTIFNPDNVIFPGTF